MARSQDIKTGLVRASFVQNLFEARAAEEGGTEKYGCTLLIPKSETGTLAAIEGIIIEACVASNWGDAAKVKDLIAKGLIKIPVLDGDGPQGISKKTQERHPGYAGHFFVRCTSGKDYKPKVLDVYANEIASNDPTRIKSGDHGYGGISAFTWDHPKTGKGVTIGIGVFQKIKDGEALGGTGGPDLSQFKAEKVETDGAAAETQGGAGAGGMFG